MHPPAASATWLSFRFCRLLIMSIEACGRVLGTHYYGSAPLVDRVRQKYTLASSPDILSLGEGQKCFVLGDIHGDFDLLLSRFKLTECLDNTFTLNWKEGNNSIVVLVGDLLDRGNAELRCIEFICRLSHQASDQDGAVMVVLGNHEVMNIINDFRNAKGGQSEWEAEFSALLESRIPGWDPDHCYTSVRKGFPSLPVKFAVCEAGGPLAEVFFSHCKVAIKVDSTLIVHASWGLELTNDYRSVCELNDDCRRWLSGSLHMNTMCAQNRKYQAEQQMS